MKARFSEDGSLVIKGDTAEECLALTAWQELWSRTGAGFRVEIMSRARPEIEVVLRDVRPSFVTSQAMGLSLVGSDG